MEFEISVLRTPRCAVRLLRTGFREEHIGRVRRWIAGQWEARNPIEESAQNVLGSKLRKQMIPFGGFMDITPSQPAQVPTEKRKAASTVAANSNKKPSNKQTESQKIPAAMPAGSPVIPAKTPPLELIEMQRVEDRDGMIAKAAYYLAERRNFAPGHELQDWLEAEQQLRK